MLHVHRPPRRAAVLAALITLGAAVPAYADHPAADVGPAATGAINTVSAATLPQGASSVGLGLLYVKPERLPDAKLASRAGRHIHAHSSEALWRASLGVAYGVTDNLTLGLSLPYVRRAGIREGEHAHENGAAINSVIARGDSAGIGDLTALAKWRFAGDRERQAALLFGLKLPTGETRELDARGERFETEHQPGSGSWDPMLGLALSVPVGRASLDASLLYTIATNGSQNTRLGNRASYGVGLTYRLGAQDDHHDHGGAGTAHAHSAWDAVLELNGEWEGRQRVGGEIDAESGGHVLYLSPGLRHASESGWTAFVSLGIPVAQHIRLSHPENEHRLVAGIGWSF